MTISRADVILINNYMLRRINKISAKKRQAKYDKMPVIRFDNRVKVRNIFELFDKLFLLRYPTYYVKYNKRQCLNNRSRSVRDAYLLVRHYFPDMTYRQVYDLAHYIFTERYKAVEKRYHGSWDWMIESFKHCSTVGMNVCRLHHRVNRHNPRSTAMHKALQKAHNLAQTSPQRPPRDILEQIEF